LETLLEPGADDACDFVDRGRGIDVPVGGTPPALHWMATERDSRS
jgi:hypothetical protein